MLQITSTPMAVVSLDRLKRQTRMPLVVGYSTHQPTNIKSTPDSEQKQRDPEEVISMHNKFLLVLLIASVSGCVQPGQVVDANGTEYSEYIQCLVYAESKEYSFDALETLGKERLPSGHEFSERDRRFLASPDAIPSVTEVYVRNHSNDALTVTLTEIQKNSFKHDLRKEVLEVPANGWAKSKPLVRASSIYQPNTHSCTIRFHVDDVAHTLRGEWNRLTVKELAQRQ